MTPKDLVINCVIQYRKPFSAELLANLTEVDLPVIHSLMQELEADQIIKRISEKDAIYVYTRKREVRISNEAREAWSYNQADCRRLVKCLSAKRYTSARAIAADFGKSRQWVFLYLEALASIDALGIDQDGYFVKPKVDLTRFGTVIKPGIINKLRENHKKIKAKQIKEEKAKNPGARELRKQASERWSAWMKSRENEH
jgi:hypothetical protein